MGILPKKASQLKTEKDVLLEIFKLMKLIGLALVAGIFIWIAVQAARVIIPNP